MRHLRVRLAIASRGGSRSKPGGRTTRTPCGPRPVEGKWPGMPRGAPTGAYYQVQRLLGAPHPSHWGMGKETGSPPPEASEGPAERWLFFALSVGLFDSCE